MPVARIQCRNLIAEIVNMQISSVDWLVAAWCLFICFDDVPLIFLCFNASASDVHAKNNKRICTLCVSWLRTGIALETEVLLSSARAHLAPT